MGTERELHFLECSTCAEFEKNGCETHADCPWVYECAKLGTAYTPKN